MIRVRAVDWHHPLEKSVHRKSRDEETGMRGVVTVITTLIKCTLFFSGRDRSGRIVSADLSSGLILASWIFLDRV